MTAIRQIAGCHFLAFLLLANTVLRAAVASPLHDAAFAWDLATVKSLVEKKHVRVNIKDKQGQTPLHSAFLANGITNGFSHSYAPKLAQVVQYLLQKGADPNLSFSNYGGLARYYPLHAAAYDGNMVLVPMLIVHNATVDIRDSRGYTPLFQAALCDFRLSCDDCSRPKVKQTWEVLWKAGAKPTSEYLIKKGANPLAKGKDGITALQRVPVPSTPAEFKKRVWYTGTCRATYYQLKAAQDAYKKNHKG